MKVRNMPQNNIPPYFDIFTFIWVMLLSLWGGTVHTIRKIKDGTLTRFSISEWVGDVVISGFIGVATYALCRHAGIDEWLSAFLIAVTSHQGARGLMLTEALATKFIKSKFGLKL